jgi:hypothetical protein
VKKLTAENWLTVDPVIASGVFVRLSLADGAVELSPPVPDTVRDQVEIARGAMTYGSLFYPLFTLGLEQLFRVTESAARAKAGQLGMSTGRKYHEILADLRAAHTLTDTEYREWTAVRQFRNVTTHATEAMVLAPGAAIGMFTRIVESINRLFAA